MTIDQKIEYIKTLLERKRTEKTINKIISEKLYDLKQEIQESIRKSQLEAKSGIHSIKTELLKSMSDWMAKFDEEIKNKINQMELAKPKDGEPGKPGYTPVKGKDYFDGQDGYTPVKGIDYQDGKDAVAKDGKGIDTVYMETGELIIKLSDGKKINLGYIHGGMGNPGLSAYDHARNGGYLGTEAEFNILLASAGAGGSLVLGDLPTNAYPGDKGKAAYDLRHSNTLDHGHANKTTLDTYTQTEANLSDAVSKKHSNTLDHSNASDHTHVNTVALAAVSGTNTGDVAFEAAPTNIKMNGAVNVGVLGTVARADHIHASDTNKEPSITADLVSKFWSGTKTWRDLATDVRAIALTGLSVATNSAALATDTLLVAIGKLQAQITNRQILGAGTALPATTGSMTATMDGALKTITPTGACTFNASGGQVGSFCTFIITTSGTTSYILTFGTNFKTTATLTTGAVTAKVFAIDFICKDGTLWVETGRTTAM